MSTLPLEVIFLIIEALKPSNPTALLPPQDKRTRTLLSLTRVSKSFYWPATRALREHCAYLDTRARAKTFAACLQLSPPKYLKVSGSQDPGLRGVRNLFVSCFPDDDGFVPSQEVIEPGLVARVEMLENVVAPEDLVDPQTYSPVSENSSETPPDPSPLDDLGTSMAVHDIFKALGPSLRRLVIDIPLRTLWPENDRKHIKKVLWRGFEALVHLEEFTSVRDELFLYASYQQPWSFAVWPDLRRLSLYNLDLSSDTSFGSFLMDIFSEDGPKEIQHLVCPRPDGLEEGVDALREMYDSNARRAGSRTLVLTHIDSEELQPESMFENKSLKNLIFVQKSVPRPPVSDSSEDLDNCDPSPADIVQHWTRTHALQGTLWIECSKTAT